MRAAEFISEKRKRKSKSKRRYYGYGYGGWFGLDSGYSGDGSGGGGESVEREDQHPNEKPMGPETKPTMPMGTIRVKISDVYDWYKLGQHISDLPNLDKNDFGEGPPQAVISFGSEDEEHKYLKLIQQLGLEVLDVDPKAADRPGVKTDPRYNVD